MSKERYYDYDGYVKYYFDFVKAFASCVKKLANSFMVHHFFIVKKAPKIVDYKFHKHAGINFNSSQSILDYIRTKGFTTEMITGITGDMLQKEMSENIDKP